MADFLWLFWNLRIGFRICKNNLFQMKEPYKIDRFSFSLCPIGGRRHKHNFGIREPNVFQRLRSNTFQGSKVRDDQKLFLRSTPTVNNHLTMIITNLWGNLDIPWDNTPWASYKANWLGNPNHQMFCNCIF